MTKAKKGEPSPEPQLTPNEQLRALKDEHKLRNTDVAHLLQLSVKSVENWLADPSASYFRPMRERDLNVLKERIPGFVKARP